MDLKGIERKCFCGIELEFNSFCKLVFWSCIGGCCDAKVIGYGDHTLNSPSDLLSQILLALCINHAAQTNLPFSDYQFNRSIFQLRILTKRVLNNRLDFQVRDAFGEATGFGIWAGSWIDNEIIVEFFNPGGVLGDDSCH